MKCRLVASIFVLSSMCFLLSSCEGTSGSAADSLKGNNQDKGASKEEDLNNEQNPSAPIVLPKVKDVYVSITDGEGNPYYIKNDTAYAEYLSENQTGCAGYSIEKLGSDFYFVGSCTTSGVHKAGYWKNGVWNLLPVSDATRDSFAVDVIVNSQGKIVILGKEQDEFGYETVIYWEDGVRHVVNFLYAGPYDLKKIVEVSDGYKILLRAADEGFIAKSDGTSTKLERGCASDGRLCIPNAVYPSDMTVDFGDRVVVSGYNSIYKTTFNQGMRYPQVGYWDSDGFWHSISEAYANKGGQTTGVAVYDSKLYLSGIAYTNYFTDKYDSVLWNDFNISMISIAPLASRSAGITVDEGDVYIAGAVTYDGTSWEIGYWKNGVWNASTSGIYTGEQASKVTQIKIR